MDFITDSEFRLLIGLIEVAHSFRKGELKVDERLWKGNGKLLERSLSRLQEYQVLTFFPYKERKKEEINEEETNVFSFDFEKDSEEKFALHFQKFILETIGSADLGFVKSFWKKSHNAFLTTRAFDEFCSTIMTRKNFQAGDWKDQFSYFQVSLKEEIKARLEKK